RRWPTFGAVEELVGDHEIKGRQLFLERPDGAERQQPLHAKLLEGVDVRPERQIRRRDAVAATVAGQKDDFATADLALNEGVRRRAPGGFHPNFPALFQRVHVIEAAASDNSDLGHESPMVTRVYTSGAMLRLCLFLLLGLTALSAQQQSGPRAERNTRLLLER